MKAILRKMVSAGALMAMCLCYPYSTVAQTKAVEPQKSRRPPTVEADVAINFPGPWWNDANANDDQVLRDYSALKPVRLISATVLLRDLQFISWEQDIINTSVAVGPGAPTTMWISSPTCKWLFFFDSNQLKIQSRGCTYPKGVRGFFDVTTLYQPTPSK